MALKTIIASLTEHVTDNATAIDADRAYDDMLDECYSLESVGGPFTYMCASKVLEALDPVAYRCGFSDWLDSCEWIEINGSYYESRDVEKERDEFIDEIDSAITDAENERDGLQEEIDELKNDFAGTPDFPASRVEAIEDQIASLDVRIAELNECRDLVKKHTF